MVNVESMIVAIGTAFGPPIFVIKPPFECLPKFDASTFVWLS